MSRRLLWHRSQHWWCCIRYWGCGGRRSVDQGNPLFEPTGFRTETGLPISRRQCNFPQNWDATNVGSRTISFQASGSFVTAPCQDSAVGPIA
ncbi:MAG: hypothetical protein GY943_33415 [Chloroflexi bacterium]|nr:hypothetical protein [Chloroflexota bacterium]